jgi:hypothetical protein
MPQAGLFRRLLDRIAAVFDIGQRNKFTCGDCTMNARCGLPPSDQCVARAAQISSGRGRPHVTNLSAPY